MTPAEIVLINVAIIMFGVGIGFGINHEITIRTKNGRYHDTIQWPSVNPAKGLDYYEYKPYVQGEVIATRDLSFKGFLKEIFGFLYVR